MTRWEWVKAAARRATKIVNWFMDLLLWTAVLVAVLALAAWLASLAYVNFGLGL